MAEQYNRKIIFEDGSEYLGFAFGDTGDRVCEIVFNTSMVGYQEILSDPSYTYQAVVMTYPLIGNYGICREDYETKTPTIGALIVREYNPEPSNFRSEESLSTVMKRYNIPGIAGVDTRQITRSIRDLGSRKVLITGVETSLEQGLEILKSTTLPKDSVSKVSGCTRRVAFSVMITSTSACSLRRRLTTSQALYAAMPPVTPSTTCLPLSIVNPPRQRRARRSANHG